MAQFLGALAILGLVTSGLVKLFSKWNDQIPGILTANGVSLFVATVIAGFGMADGRDPVFGEAFSVYVLPQLAILGVSLWYWSRSKNRSAVPATADAPSNAMPTSEAFPHAKKGSWVKRSAIAVGSFLLLVAVYLGANLIGREAGREGAKMVMAPTQAQKEAASNQGLQEAAVEVRKTLPKKLDEAITLIDVRVSHMRTAYLHE